MGRVVSAREGTWIRIPEAARLVGMSRQGMRKRLLRLNQIAGGRLLRRESATGRGGHFEVCVEVLRELRSYDPKERERELGHVHWRIGEVEGRLEALRNAHRAHRRRTERRLDQHQKRLDTHDELLEALKQLSEASARVATVVARHRSG